MSNSIKDTIRHDCPMRHENGNCLVAGGFCTSIVEPLCEILHNAYNAGKFDSMEQMKKQGFRKQSEWISVDDRLPEESGEYLTFHEHGSCGVIYYNSSIHLWNVYYFDDVRNAIRSVTHWMPIPEAPKMEGGAAQ